MNIFYHGDCLFVLRHDIAPESIDLIYLDPPFFTGKIQKGKWRPDAMEVSFQDSKKFWKEKGISTHAPNWLKYIAIKRPDFASYLYYMMERLEACHKVLKKTGSMYLHCDYRASHYLKMIMDEIFGDNRFVNEIIWRYKTFHGRGKKNYYPKKHDAILLYAKSAQRTFHQVFEEDYKDTIDYKRWSKYLVLGNKIIGANMPMQDTRFTRFYRRWVREHGHEPNADDIVYEVKGQPVDTVWDIKAIDPKDKNRLGYPTQKPEPLLERIIKASSNEGHCVLDPFCGCGTTAIVASKLNRRFIGIDIDTSERKKGELPTAFTVIKNRSHELFEQARYISRDLGEVQEMTSGEFENWVNEFHKAEKPYPDTGIDGIAPDGIGIQTKTFEIGYSVVSQLVQDAKYHPKTTKPVKKVIAVSQTGFDDKARQRKFEIETAEGIEVCLTTPEEMLKLETS